MDDIKQGLRAKPTCHRRTDRFVSKCGICFINFHRLPPASGRRRIREKLCVAALVQAHEPKYRLLDRLSDSQKAVILQERGLLIAQLSGDIMTFFLGENNAVELLIHNVVLKGGY